MIYMVMDAETAACMHLHDGYVMSNRTCERHAVLNGPHRNRRQWCICQKTPRKSFLIKAPPCPFIILLYIISMLQLSVAIRLAFFMQINLTAQQSVSYANSCSLIFPSLLRRSLALAPFYLIFSGICRGCYICIIYHRRLEYAPFMAKEYGY